MAHEQPVMVSEFLASFKQFMDQAVAQAPAVEEDEPIFRRHLQEHFGTDPARLPIVSEQFRTADHPNVHLALHDYVHADGRSADLLGLTSPQEHIAITLAHLTQREANEWTRPQPGPVTYVNIELGDETVLACVHQGLYLVHDGDRPIAILVRGPSEHGWLKVVSLEVMARERADAEHLLRMLRVSMRQRNVYRGHVISLEGREGQLAIRVHRLPTIRRDDIILPEGLLTRIERQTIGFARVAAKLRAAGRHLKRGLLLYGPPGTGKTLTAMYLASQMPDRTIILLTGGGLGAIEESCKLARLLQPATLILEDVDLVAEERTNQSTGTNAVLFELLNQMDGLEEDADLLFLLTTNRPEILEPALAARPGRVDQALEIPLPDRASRARLLELYGAGLTTQLSHRERVVDQTEGVSAAFLRELLRKAALLAADDHDPIVVEDRHVDAALHELVVDGGALTTRLLGAGTAFGRDRRRDSC